MRNDYQIDTKFKRERKWAGMAGNLTLSHSLLTLNIDHMKVDKE